MDQRVLVIVPAYNEEATIARVLQGIREAAPALERIVVTDGSRDGTSRIVEEMGEKQLKLPCNLGYGLALQTGMKYALDRGYDAVVTIDADGQHDPRDIPHLLHTLTTRGADLVIGSRFSESKLSRTTMSRRAGQVAFSVLTGVLTGRRVYDTTSGFKAFGARACEVIASGTFLDFHIETIVRLHLLGFRVLEHPIVVAERAHGASMHSLSNALQYPLKTSLLTLVATADALIERRKK